MLGVTKKHPEHVLWLHAAEHILDSAQNGDVENMFPQKLMVITDMLFGIITGIYKNIESL